MEWYNFLAAFFSGAFLANMVPHFIYGIGGNKFPTTFSKPRGIGLSSSTTNVVWGLFNLVIGYLLFGAGKISTGQPLLPVIFFAGIAAMSIMLSIHFTQKHKE